jgi:hypothetical protein
MTERREGPREDDCEGKSAREDDTEVPQSSTAATNFLSHPRPRSGRGSAFRGSTGAYGESNQAPARSRHSGLSFSTIASFSRRGRFFIHFSRAIASGGVG